MKRSLIIISMFFFASSALGQFRIVNEPAGSRSGGSTVNSTPVDDTGTVSNPTSREDCPTSNNISLQLFRNLTTNPDYFKVSFATADKSKLSVRIPSYYSDCLDLELKYKFDQNNLFISVTNDKTYPEYESCLKGKGILSADGSEFDASKATVKPVSFQTVDVPNFDEKKNMSVFFESPFPDSTNGNYGPAFDEGYVSSNSCFQHENMKNGGLALYQSPESEAIQRVIQACNSLDYQQILRELELLDESTLGNAGYLRDVLEGALLSARKQRAEEIYKRLEQINDQFAPSNEDKKEGKKVGVTEREAKKLAREYEDLTKELDEILITPTKEKITELIKKHEDSLVEEVRDEIEDEIRELNEVVGEYADMDHKYIYAGLEEYALNDKARDIEEVRLRSSAYSRVYVGSRDGRGQKLSPREADRYVDSRLRNFDQTLDKWAMVYRVRSGDRHALEEQRNEVERSYGRLNRDWRMYQEYEQKYMQKYCGRNFLGQVKNPYRCRSFMQDRGRRAQIAMRRRQENLLALRSSGDTYQSYRSLYGDYVRSMQEQQTNDDPYGFYSNSDVYYRGSFGGESYSDPMSMYGFESYGMMEGRSPAMGMGGQMGMMGPNPFATSPFQMQQGQGFGAPMSPQFPQTGNQGFMW